MRDGKIIANDSLDGLRGKMGLSLSLSEIYSRLASPQTVENIARYFEGMPR
jgi:hypothetical protein